MKKIILISAMGLLGSLLSLTASAVDIPNHNAVKMGDSAPCVILEGVSSTGANIDRCIREGAEGSQTRYTIIKFFSVSCSECSRVHKLFANIFGPGGSQEGALDNTTMNYVGLDRNSAEVRQYARNKRRELQRMNATVFVDSDRDAKRAYDVFQTPTIFVLDKQNDFKVVYKASGTITDTKLKGIINAVKTTGCHPEASKLNCK